MFDRINPLIIFVVVVVFAFFVLFRQVKGMNYRLDDLEQDLNDLHNAQAFCSKPLPDCAGADEDEDTCSLSGSSTGTESNLELAASGASPIIGTLYMSADATPVCVIKEEAEEEVPLIASDEEEEAAEAEPAPAARPKPAAKPKAASKPTKRGGARKKGLSEIEEACELVDEIAAQETA